MSRNTTRARTGSDRSSLYDNITNKIIGELDAGRVPWVQPWGTAAAKAPLTMPRIRTPDRLQMEGPVTTPALSWLILPIRSSMRCCGMRHRIGPYPISPPGMPVAPKSCC